MARSAGSSIASLKKSPVALAEARAGGGTRSDSGQAAVELALALPLFCLLLLAAVQIVVVAGNQLLVIQAARVAARAAAVSADPVTAGNDAAHRVLGSTAQVSTATHDAYVTVTVSFTTGTDVPLVGSLMPEVHLVGQATMLLEPP